MSTSLDFIAERLGLIKKNNDDFDGYGGLFVDDARVSESLDYSLTTPDTYVEAGNSVNDHTIYNPKVITIEGEVSEVFEKDNPILTEYFKYASGLGVISSYLPSRTATQITQVAKVTNFALGVTRYIDKAISDFNYVKGFFTGEEESVQSKFITFVDVDLYKLGKIITIETKLGYYPNMKLQTANITKANDGDYLKYKLVFKEWRTATTESTGFKEVAKNSAGDATNQTADNSDKGNVTGVDNSSLFTKAKDGFASFLGF